MERCAHPPPHPHHTGNLISPISPLSGIMYPLDRVTFRRINIHSTVFSYGNYVFRVSSFINAPELVVKIQCVKQTYENNTLQTLPPIIYSFEIYKFIHICLQILESGTRCL